MNDTNMGKSELGLLMNESHLPDQTVIDAYGDGGFRFSDMSHKGSLMCLPSGIYGWDVEHFSDLDADHFKRALDEQEMELLLIGTGQDLIPVPEKLRQKFMARNIRVEPMSTGAAVRTYNILLAEKRSIGAAFLAVE
jgi:uncharacterized protein